MRRIALLASVAVLVMTACGGGGDGAEPGSGSNGAARPQSSATISIEAPTDGAVIKDDEVKLKLALEGGRVVEPDVREVTPDTGHIHVELDGVVVSMNYGLEQTIKVTDPGTHTLRVEFVAADHAPFDPRVFDDIAFTVK